MNLNKESDHQLLSKALTIGFRIDNESKIISSDQIEIMKKFKSGEINDDEFISLISRSIIRDYKRKEKSGLAEKKNEYARKLAQLDEKEKNLCERERYVDIARKNHAFLADMTEMSEPEAELMNFIIKGGVTIDPRIQNPEAQRKEKNLRAKTYRNTSLLFKKYKEISRMIKLITEDTITKIVYSERPLSSINEFDKILEYCNIESVQDNKELQILTDRIKLYRRLFEYMEEALKTLYLSGRNSEYFAICAMYTNEKLLTFEEQLEYYNEKTHKNATRRNLNLAARSALKLLDNILWESICEERAMVYILEKIYDIDDASKNRKYTEKNDYINILKNIPDNIFENEN